MDRHLTVTITREPIYTPPTTTPEIRRVILWSNPIAIADGFSSSRGQPEGQTQGQQALFTPYLIERATGKWAGAWGANQNSPSLTNADVLRIGAMQTDDEFSVDVKMSHIMAGGKGQWGQAMMATFDPSSNWQAATNIRINQAVYAGNNVEVLEHKTMTVDTFGTVPMVRIRTGWDQSHIYTSVNAANNHIWRTKGFIYLPLYARPGWDWWLLDRWLEPLL